MNRIVLKWAPIPLTAALLMLASPSLAQGAKKPADAPVAQTAKSKAAPRAAYASADAVCTTGRRKLWTEAGWIVRRVTLCH